jgi:fused signal recognition particle receptor
MELLYVLIAIAVVAAAVFLLARKPPAELPPAPQEKEPERPKPVKKNVSVAPKVDAEAPPSASEPTEPVLRESAPAAELPRASAPPAPTRKSEAATPKPVPAKARDITGLRRGLTKSREATGFFGRLRALFAGKKELSPQLASEIEEVLLTSDVGVETTALLLDRIKQGLSSNALTDPEAVWSELRSEARAILESSAAGALEIAAKPTVVLMVGVNGAGKTTTIGKLATKLTSSGKKCILAAGDTFRAAAVQQLVVWGERVGCEVVRGKDGADPGSVVFEAIKRAQELGADVVLADTAGRLHTKSNLMSEMKKIAKTAEKALPGAPHEIFLVVDSTNGQNAFAQAKEFKEALPLTGIVLTKLDGTAKGGVVLGVANTLKVPVRYVGLGERPDDLHEFSADDFVEALLGRESDAN